MNASNKALTESWRLSLHNKRPRTIALYLSEVERFADWLAENGRGGDLLTVTRRDAEAYLSALREAGRAPATIRSRWIALRSFYRWAAEEEEIAESPFAQVKVDRPAPPPPDVLSAEDVAALLKVCSGTTFNDRRDAAMIRFMLATGVRVSELTGLELADVDLAARLGVIRDGKGGRQRVVRFDAATAAAVDRYKRARARHRFASLPALWIGHRGAMTRKGVPSMLTKRAAEAGIGHVHPHQFRHTFADRWLAAGGTEGDLQRLGGWENSDVMRRYGEARAVDRALDAYDRIMREQR